MIISFVGKGGSGKTTLTSIVARMLAAQGKTVLAIDADINQHLSDSLGVEYPQLTFRANAGEIKTWLKAHNTHIESIDRMVKTTPPGTGSLLPTLQQFINTFPKMFSMDTISGVYAAASGEINEEDLGISCFHGSLATLELLLSHLRETKDEYVLVDMTAGADAFSSGMFTKFDSTYVICEPTKKGVVVYEQYMKYSKGYEIRTRVIANKCEDQEDKLYVSDAIKQTPLTSIGVSSYIKKLSRGDIRPLSEMPEELQSELQPIISDILTLKSNATQRYKWTLEFHEINATRWMNQRFNYDFLSQIDRSFVW